MFHYNTRNNIATALLFASFTVTAGWATSANALDVNIAEDLPYVETVHDGSVVKIQRNQNQNNTITGGFSKTSRKCPPFCIQPIKVAPDVQTVGELEVLEFISKELNNGTGILIDARTPSWHSKGTIPGSVNIPFTTFSTDQNDLVLSAALGKLGVRKQTNKSVMSRLWNGLMNLTGNRKHRISNKWDFTDAKDLMLWCNGMWCGQSPRAIKGLLKLGYPAEKIHYYRGGMQSWRMLGFNITTPTNVN
jgi:rhodanese-related sulfurtransferase